MLKRSYRTIYNRVMESSDIPNKREEKITASFDDFDFGESDNEYTDRVEKIQRENKNVNKFIDKFNYFFKTKSIPDIEEYTLINIILKKFPRLNFIGLVEAQIFMQILINIPLVIDQWNSGGGLHLFKMNGTYNYVYRYSNDRIKCFDNSLEVINVTGSRDDNYIFNMNIPEINLK